MSTGRVTIAALLTGSSLALAGCLPDDPAAPKAAAPAPASSASPSEKADPRLEDLSYLVDRARSIHPRLFHGVKRAQIRSAVENIEARINSLDRYEFMTEVMRLTALFGAQGGEAHTGLFPFEQSIPLHAFPLRLYVFPEGVFVVDAEAGLRELVGSEVTHIDGKPIERIVRRVQPLIGRDNEHSLVARVPWLLVQAEVLHALRVTKDARAATFTFAGREGTNERRITAIPNDEFQEWAGVWHAMIPAGLPEDDDVPTLARLDRDIWIDHMQAGNLVFIQYNATIPATEGIAARLRRLADAHPTARVVLDLRHNPGGNVHTFAPLLEQLLRPDIRSRLVVLIGRATLSASAVLISELEERFDPLLVGEATGAKPSFYGDPVAVRLPSSDLLVEIAGLHWPASRGRERDAYEPDIRIGWRAEHYFADRDPVLEWLIQ